MTEQEIASKLDEMRVNAILDLHEWESTKGNGVIINQDGTIYDYSWFLGFNNQNNSFGMCTKLEKRENLSNCDVIKDYLQNDLMIFDMEYDTDFRSDGGCDIVVKIDDKSKYSNNIKLYNKIKDKMVDLLG